MNRDQKCAAVHDFATATEAARQLEGRQKQLALDLAEANERLQTARDALEACEIGPERFVVGRLVIEDLGGNAGLVAREATVIAALGTRTP